MKTGIVCAIAGLAFALSPAALAQSAPSVEETRESNLSAYVDLLRKDLKREKVAVLTDLMQLSPEEAAKFWPVYGEYDKSLTRLGDEKLAWLKVYGESINSLSDAKTMEIANGLLDVEARRNQLKKQFFQRMCQAVSVKQAARFLQIENQIEKLVDLQIMSVLPIVE